MANKPQKAQKSKNRPVATTGISQPAVEPVDTSFSSFSPSSKYFAFVSLAIAKHRLRIYDAVGGHSVAEHVVPTARVSSISWTNLDHDRSSSPTRKKRKKDTTSNQLTDEVVLLGLSDGSVLLISTTHGRVIRSLSHPSCSAPILALVSSSDTHSNIWTSSADGNVSLWNMDSAGLIGSWKTDDRIPYTSLALRTDDEETVVLAAHHAIRLVSLQPESQKPKQLAHFTGHASSIKQLVWGSSKRFYSRAEGDRVIPVWDTSDADTQESMVASIQLDSDAQEIASGHGPSDTQLLLSVSISGKISIVPVPLELLKGSSSSKISTLFPRCTISTLSGQDAAFCPFLTACFIPTEEGAIRIARLAAGILPIFDVIRFFDAKGHYVTNIVVEPRKVDLVKAQADISNRRYAEPTTVAVSAGSQLAQGTMAGGQESAPDGELDVAIAELSLGQRLAAQSGEELRRWNSDDEDNGPGLSRGGTDAPTVAATGSLIRTLIQALHSLDSKLLETCLAHSDQSLIRNTVKRLPPQLAVPLIITCVDRLGRGARGGNMKGGGGGSSSQRGSTLISWIKTVLTVHSAHLMTIPDLVARLSGLHATLTTRLALQESLLSLSGRLDMVLSQIEMRSSNVPAPVAAKRAKTSKSSQAIVTHYVEGESDEDDANGDVEIEMQDAEDDASIEDVEFAGGSSDDEDESEAQSDEDEDDEDDEDMAGFIDDEAEVDSEDDEEEDSDS